MQTATLSLTLCVCAGTLIAATYPPPFPRKDASKVLDNNRVEVWDVTWPKGQNSGMHEHPCDQISITLVGGAVRVTRPDGNPTTGKSELGSVTFVRKGTVHSEEGMSDVPQHKMMVELKPSVSSAEKAVTDLPGAVKVLDNERATVWDFTWKPGQKVPGRRDSFDSVSVYLAGGTIRSVTSSGKTKDAALKSGDVVFSPRSPDVHTDKVVSGAPRAVIVQLK
jgi:quercetin dioxygenase-like cupin family protein